MQTSGVRANMRRRVFLGGLASGWAASALGQPRLKPTVAYLSTRSPSDSAHIIAAFHKGLGEEGYFADRNVTIEERFAEGRINRLPEFAAELMKGPATVMVATGGTSSVIAAKPVVQGKIPLLFAMGGDPIKLGVVASLARPGDNLTGIAFLVNGLAAKHTQLLRELAPKAAKIGFLGDAKDPNFASDTKETQDAANQLGLALVVVTASNDQELQSAFGTLMREQVDALFVQVGPVTTNLRSKIAALAAWNKLPAIYGLREFVDAGGLMSYGTSITDANRQLGAYTGQVLKGRKPADLPVVQSTSFELVINRKVADALRMEIPTSILLRANEVID
jgi:putative tryptophan/tyrosine transport system substrate-binding protein